MKIDINLIELKSKHMQFLKINNYKENNKFKIKSYKYLIRYSLKEKLKNNN